ncbi:hypothetical protein ES702_07050 [subsurface metagenome]
MGHLPSQEIFIGSHLNKVSDIMAKTEISKDKVLNPGDVVELHFKTSGAVWLKATESAIVEYSLERRKEFKVKSIDYQQPGEVIFTVTVQETNPVIVTVAVICGAIAIAAIAFGWMFDKAYLVAKTMPAQVLSLGLIVVAGILLFMFFKK